MAPHPMKDADKDFLERKEELMIAKQLRQSRVTILPRVSSIYCKNCSQNITSLYF